MPGNHVVRVASSTPAEASVKVEPPRSSWMRNQVTEGCNSPNAARRGSRSMRPSTSAPTPAPDSRRIMTTRCRTSLPERYEKFGVVLEPEKLSHEEQVEAPGSRRGEPLWAATENQE